MGTRSLICVFYKGRFVVAQYTQFDGYPEGQGLTILKFLVVPGNITRLTNGLENITLPSKEEIEEIYEKVNKLEREEELAKEKAGDFSFYSINKMKTLYPSLSRETGGDILEVIASSTPEKKVPLSLFLEFANDGLFCEWAYVVDLDNEVFEIFGGAQKKADATNKRFNDVGKENDSVPAFVKSFSFNDLPAGEVEFMAALKEKLGGDDY
ncbi:hypothetical protein AJ79_06407 [Helicocarpus griseus UAMH5409]|uniref:Uncharacterized protein n=1 Tax=Helicocarpus griseus UAMH5409 TaxID=1447875 RepID=A0A2B7X5K0_9EURO|nr:hypothetical protein AJ79_06407 [Helicocarpus griseus UAMH5409]